MLEQLSKTIARFRMILPGQRISVACSGGPDSTALLLGLQELSAQLGFVVSVCHFNHRLRGAESDADEQFVRDLADRLQLAVHIAGADVRRAAQAAHANLESKARQLRYDFFRSLISSGKADRIAVGHTADDQAETVLHRLIRGAGTKGLGGIHPVVENQIIRPLIEVCRRDVLEWLKGRNQPWREDATNLDLRLTRNRIRHKLLPELSEYNPRIAEVLAGTAEIARDEEAYWQGILPEFVSQAAVQKDGRILLDVERLREMPVAAARRVLRWAIGQPVDFQQMQQILALAYEGRSGNSVSLARKLCILKDFSHLIIQREGVEGSFGYCHQAEVPCRLEVPEIGSLFRFELVPYPAGTQAGYNKVGVLLDRRLIGIPLTVRNWEPGDRYRPTGHRTRKKIKEFFQRKRISTSDRQGWPVVLAGDEIIWVRGLDVAEGFSPHPQSNQAILLEECRM